MQTSYTSFERILRIVMFVAIVLITITMVYPFWYVIIYALSDSNAAIEGSVLLWPLKPTLAVFHRLMGMKMLWTSYGNSIFVTFLGTILAVALSTTLAYPLSIRRLRGRKWVSMMLFFTMLFNGGMIPNYLLIKDLGLLDSRWSLILPSLMSAYNVMVLRSFFLGIPPELEESASIDGASPLRVLVQIILPVSLPALAVQAMFYGVAYWNSYFDCVLYIESTDKMTLQAYLRTLIASATASSSNSADSMGDFASLSNETVRMGCVAAAVIPVLLVYPWLQKYYVTGLVVGSVKG